MANPIKIWFESQVVIVYPEGLNHVDFNNTRYASPSRMHTSTDFLYGIKHENIIKMNNKTKKYFAHSLEGKALSEWQKLEDHIRSVAAKAIEFAGKFCAGEYVRIIKIKQKWGWFIIMGERYDIQMEISGKTAMWTRPDTGVTPISYPVPAWSAAKGLFESIVRLKNTIIIPTAVEICAPIVYHDYTTNY